MAEITRQRTGELMRGVFSILMPHREGLPAKEVLARLALEIKPTEFEEGSYPGQPNARRYEKIVRFSTIGPVKAGWLIKNRRMNCGPPSQRRSSRTLDQSSRLLPSERCSFTPGRHDKPRLLARAAFLDRNRAANRLRQLTAVGRMAMETSIRAIGQGEEGLCPASPS